MTRQALVRRGSVVLAVVLIVSALAVASMVRLSREPDPPEKRQHVHDETGLILARDMPGWEALLGAIFDESGIDIRLYFVNDLAGETLEAAALKRMQALKIGARTAPERGGALSLRHGRAAPATPSSITS